MKLLLGYDGSVASEAVLSDPRLTGLPDKVAARVVTAADVFLPPPDSVVQTAGPRMAAALALARGKVLGALKEARRSAARARHRLQAAHPTWKIRVLTRADSPARLLLKQVETWQPDLLVVGSHGYSALERVLLGSVSQKVLAEATCSVRIARLSSSRASEGRRLVIGFDGSPDAWATVEVVAHRVWPEETQICLVSAWDNTLATAEHLFAPLAFGEHEQEEADTQARLRAVAEEAADILCRSGLKATVLVLEGDPRHVLLEEAQQWQADAIFVGACGLRGQGSCTLGSVAAATAARAHCSVEVVRPVSGS